MTRKLKKSHSFNAITNLNVKNIDIKVFPNPSNGIINLEINKEVQNVFVIISSQFGKTIFFKEFKSMNGLKEEITLKNYKPGIYLMKIIGREKVFSKKLLLQ